MAPGSYLLPIITLNVNGLNVPTKRQRLADGYKNKTPIYAVYKTSTSKQGTHTTESEGLEKDIQANGDQKKAGVAILISDKIDFKTKTVKRDKDGNYIMIKGSIQEEDITIINIYAPNTGAPQYVRQMLTSKKGEINNNTRIYNGEKTISLTSGAGKTGQPLVKE